MSSPSRRGGPNGPSLITDILKQNGFIAGGHDAVERQPSKAEARLGESPTASRAWPRLTGGNQSTPPSKDDPRYYIVSAMLCLFLAVLFACLVGWVGYLVVVEYFRQDTITFWVALAIAILIWFIEEMLHLTLPCRRALRRLAHWLAERWIKHLKGE